VLAQTQDAMVLFGLLDPDTWIDRFGAGALWGVALIVFIECWLFPFLPGDSLLFVVGLLISQNEQVSQPIWLACLVLTVAAVLSNVVGYTVGARVGPALFNRPDSRFFKQVHVDKTIAFFDKYGNRAIVLARFVPIVRTFITLAAGVGRMPMRRFVTYSAIGGVLWATGVTLLGYFLGQVDFIADHIDLLLVAIVAVSLVPIAIEYWRARSAPRDPRYDEEAERMEVLREVREQNSED
jgi:membrane-associated protein